MISGRAIHCFAICLFISLNLSSAGIMEKIKRATEEGSSGKYIVPSQYRKFDKGCIYAKGQMYQIHHSIYVTDDGNHVIMLGNLEDHASILSSQNVEILVQMKPTGEPDEGFEELRSVGDACFFKYDGDSRYSNQVLHKGLAHISSNECKRDQDLEQLQSCRVVITTLRKRVIWLDILENDVTKYVNDKKKKKYSGFPKDLKEPLLRKKH